MLGMAIKLDKVELYLLMTRVLTDGLAYILCARLATR
jgi:hypothetical protein